MHGNEVCIDNPGPLTPREAEALLWIAEGKTAWEAGTILGVSESTLNAHALSAAAKLSASNRAHLVTRAFVEGILRPLRSAVVILLALHLSSAGFTDAVTAVRTVVRIRRREDLECQHVPRSEI